MKISLKNFFLCAVAALGLSAAGSASAVSILNFTGTAQLAPPRLGDANVIVKFFAVDDDNNSFEDSLRTEESSGIFASVDSGIIFDAFGPLNFSAGGGRDPFFALGDYRFDLDNSMLVNQSADFLNISGNGTIFGPGGFELPARLLLSSQAGDVRNRFSISGSLTTQDVNVPEGGSAVLFLGLGMIGVETLRRRLVKNRA